MPTDEVVALLGEVSQPSTQLAGTPTGLIADVSAGPCQSQQVLIVADSRGEPSCGEYAGMEGETKTGSEAGWTGNISTT